jgi:hypothetical protein
MKAGMR